MKMNKYPASQPASILMGYTVLFNTFHLSVTQVILQALHSNELTARDRQTDG